MQRMEPGVSLYSRRVLIQPKSKVLLPEWLRFVKGVVDSEDIPLNLSREILQDGLLIRKLRKVLTSRIIKWMSEEARKSPEAYKAFYENFSVFLKEGVCTDEDHKKDIAKLLRYETSKNEAMELSSLNEYLERQPEGKDGSKTIYYFCVPNREFALSSPYFEAFKRKGIEVLFLYDSRDEFVVNSLQEFNGAKMIGIESTEGAKKIEETEDPSGTENEESTTKPLSKDEAEELKVWVTQNLGNRVKTVEVRSMMDGRRRNDDQSGNQANLLP